MLEGEQGDGQGRPAYSSCVEGGGEYGEQLEGVIWLNPINGNDVGVGGE